MGRNQVQGCSQQRSNLARGGSKRKYGHLFVFFWAIGCVRLVMVCSKKSKSIKFMGCLCTSATPVQGQNRSGIPVSDHLPSNQLHFHRFQRMTRYDQRTRIARSYLGKKASCSTSSNKETGALSWPSCCGNTPE